jgi:hypothetical protein
MQAYCNRQHQVSCESEVQFNIMFGQGSRDAQQLEVGISPLSLPDPSSLPPRPLFSQSNIAIKRKKKKIFTFKRITPGLLVV